MNIPTTKREWRQLVGDNLVIFTFIKKSKGELRKMIGCHTFAWMPSYNRPKKDNYRPPSDNIIRIFHNYLRIIW